MVPAGRTRRRFPETDFPPTRPMSRDEVQALDAAAARRAARTVPAPAPVAAQVPAAPATAAPAPRPAAKSVQIPLRGATDFADLDELFNVSPPAPKPRNTRGADTRSARQGGLPEVARGDALLVGQSLVEGRILLKRFRKYELEIDWCRDPAQAEAMMQAHAYRLVVIDRLGGQPDAFAVCRSAKQAKGPKGAPVVILFAPSAGSMERMKAGLAGADAYLSRSVSEADLYKVLAQHRLVNLNGFAPTNVGSF
jgi:CheY-like chemotaxis protein